MNTTIQNPVAPVIAMNRPVMLKDVAEKLGMPITSVASCMSKSSRMSQAKIELVRMAAKEMGYDKTASKSYNGKINMKKCNATPRTYNEDICKCGKSFLKKGWNQMLCPECSKAKHVAEHKEYMAVYNRVRRGSFTYYNGNFKTRQEEIARMKELRAQGYSNNEIAKAVGRSQNTVLRNIGRQDPELSKQNVAMAAHIRAQKNAARKQYLINKPIREYNKRVEEHNKMKAEIARMEAELTPRTPAIEKAAQTKIDFPLVNLHTVQPTALQ